MSNRREDRDRIRRHRRRERRPHGRPRRAALTPEQRAYRVAQRRANLKLSFMMHLVTYGSVCTMLLFVVGFRTAFVVALCWGIGLAVHYFGAVVAPQLRRRWVDQEVGRQVSESVSRERRVLEGKHVQSLEELSASIAHEIRNPVTAAKSLVQQMGEDPVASQNVEYAKVALEELDRVERSISHLLKFAREEEIRQSPLKMSEVVDSALETFRDRFERSGVELQREIDAAGAMRGDPEKLRRVVINLVGNAFDALEDSDTPDPRLRLMAGENLAGTEVWLRVRDNGPGIDPARQQKIFSPFYTTKSSGTGLGLALSKKVVDAHGGRIEAHSSPGEGTEFVITFPKHVEEEGAQG